MAIKISTRSVGTVWCGDEKRPSMSQTARVADHLDDCADAILNHWRVVVEQSGDIPELAGLSRAEFLDHIPDLLDRLAARLRNRPSNGEAEGRQHGRFRWRQGLEEDDVIQELTHLRSVLTRATFDCVREQGLSLDDLESAILAISEVLDEAGASAVQQMREAAAAEAAHALAELDAGRIAVEAERVKLRTLLESLPVGVWVFDAEGTLALVNRAGEQLQGFPADEVVGRANLTHHRAYYHFFRPDGTEYAEGEIPMARALRGERVMEEEIHWRTTQAERDVLVNAAPLTDPSGAIVGAMVAAQDITQRKLAEQERIVSERRYQDLYDHSPDMMVSIDMEDLTVLQCNQTLADTLGLARSEIVGHPVLDLYDPGCLDEVQRASAEFLNTGRLDNVELRLRRRDGTTIDVSLSSSAVRDDSGRIVRSRSVWRDITARKRLEAELADSEARFRALAEQSPVMIWRAGTDAVCDYFNQRWLEFRGRTIKPEGHNGWAEGVHPDDLERCMNTYLGAFERRAPFEMAYRLLRADGQYRWITDNANAYYDSEGRFLGYIGSCVDIHDRVELEAVLERQKQAAEELSAHKTRMMSALSHDARTPLNAVVLAARLLEMNLKGQENGEVQECLRTIRHSVSNVMDLLGDMLDLTRIDAGAMPAEPSFFELAAVLAEVVAGIEPQARQKGLSVRMEPGPIAGLTLHTDRAKFKQILANILSNAVRYTQSGHIRICGELSSDRLGIAVEDTGIGIASEDQVRIFDEFATLTQPNRPVGEGTGLGLAICKRLARLLGGEIHLNSDPELGSTFTFVLPASVISETPAEATKSDAAPASLDHKAPSNDHATHAGTVLVAEDHDSSRKTLTRVLHHFGYHVVEADNGLDALTLATAQPLLAILMDVKMPGMDGIDATLALRADPRTRDLPIFALTGDVSIDNRRRLAEAGINGFLEKPVSFDALRRALDGLGVPQPHPLP
ncbi:hypothetical protein BH23PLA1_BH23PLA1_11230 [soil metagenome]